MEENVVTKKCSKCGLSLTTDNFGLDNKTSDKLRSICKQCKRNQDKAYRENKKAKKAYSNNVEQIISKNETIEIDKEYVEKLEKTVADKEEHVSELLKDLETTRKKVKYLSYCLRKEKIKNEELNALYKDNEVE